MNIKSCFITLYLLTSLFYCNAQENNIFINQSLREEFNLFKLAKVWGLSKYRHPEIGNSNINWDESLKILLSLTSEDDFDKELYNWLSLNIPIKDHYKNTSTDTTNLEVLVAPDYKWLNDKKLFSDDIISYLNKLIRLKPVSLDKHQYITNGKWNVTPVFKEEKYSEVKVWKSEYYKLLTLFRYWNIIEYFHPYKYLNTNNWDDILQDFIPRFLQQHNELSYQLMLLELFSKIEDSHSGLYEKSTDDYLGNNQIPLELVLLNDEVVIKDIFKVFKNITTLKLGEVVTHIDHIPISTLLNKHRKIIFASNEYAFKRDLAQGLVRTQKDSVSITTIRNGIKKSSYIKTIPYTILNYIKKKKPSHTSLENNIGYIYPATLKSKDELIEILEEFKTKKGIILDYRCYSFILIQHILPSFLLPKPTPYYKSTHFNWNRLGEFYYNKPTEIGKKNPEFYKGKFIVLLNEFSTSQPEFETLAYRKAPNSLVVGTNSGGTIGNITTVWLPGKIKTMISGAEVRDIDGTQIQKLGIIPDVLVEITKEGIKKGKDEILEKAIQIINQK